MTPDRGQLLLPLLEDEEPLIPIDTIDGRPATDKLYIPSIEQSRSQSVVTHRKSLESHFEPLLRYKPELGSLVSYVQNKKIPLFRLYRYKEAFSLQLVDHLLDYFNAGKRDFVFDPFVGMGSTLWCCMQRGISSVGVDRLPIATFVAQTLTTTNDLKPGTLWMTLSELRQKVDDAEPALVATDVPLINTAYDEDVLLRLRQWKGIIESLDDAKIRDVFRLLFFSILEVTSYASNDGQFLRLKHNKRRMYPDVALAQKVSQAETDLDLIRNSNGEVRRKPLPHVLLGDARDLKAVQLGGEPSILITSPPYANRYDYTRSYCLELCFHFVSNFEELRALRHSMLRSHIESQIYDTDHPVHPVVEEVVTNLRGQRLNNQRIPYMITAYFADMEQCIQQWANVLARGARIAMVVDNVRFQSEIIPVDLVLSSIAQRYGFVVEEILVARLKGNSSQQMGRYGRVPVRESIVIWKKA